MDWQVDDGFRDLLPKMKTDITLTCGERTLIIDAKYYERNRRGSRRLNTRRIGGYWTTQIPRTTLWTTFSNRNNRYCFFKV